MLGKAKVITEENRDKLRWATLGTVLALTIWSAISLATGDFSPAPEVEVTVQAPPLEKAPVDTEPAPVEEQPDPMPEMLARFTDLYAENPDTIGWITIPGTNVNYPVLRGPESDWDFYLHHNFYRTPDENGVPYIWPHQDPEENDLLFIYAHNLSDGTLFSDVANYYDQEYFEAHPTIDFSSLYTERSFQIAFVFNVWSNQEHGSFYYHPETGIEESMAFPYLLHNGWNNQEEFDHFIEQNKAHALYDTGVEVSFGDRLIALWTCSTTEITDSRLVVVAVER